MSFWSGVLSLFVFCFLFCVMLVLFVLLLFFVFCVMLVLFEFVCL